jgi:hypothetical protein
MMPDASAPATRWARGVVVVVASAAVLGVGSPAHAATGDPGVNTTGCRGTVTVSSQPPVSVPTPGPASPTRPLTLVASDVLHYNVSSETPIAKPKWHAKVAGVPLASGNATEGGKLNGEIRMRKYAPLNLTGRYFVTLDMKGAGGTCTAQVWIKLGGNPLKTVPFWIAAALTILGLAGFWFALPRARLHGARHQHTPRGVFSGLIVGLGGMLLLTFGDIIAFTTWWPYVVLVIAGPLVGLLVSLVGPTLGKPNVNPTPVRAKPLNGG